MCGICGYQGQVKDGLIKKMIDKQSHRGPDDSGLFEDRQNQVALGHNRLSIIDLSANAKQPMTNENSTVFLVFNGEIYNYKELRSEMITKKHKFASQSDSEVLIHLYEEYGPSMLSKLNGIFAFAIYDSLKNELFCARDQFGVKPFYYAETNDYFVFASELKTILAANLISKDINPVALYNHLTFLWSPSPDTMLKSVKKLEPGCAMIINDKKIKKQWKYYDIVFNKNELIKSERECIELIQKNVLNAVDRQLMSDVPVGAFLSGGLDSSAIVAMMRKIKPKDHIDCFTISWNEGKNSDEFVNDLPYARKISNFLNVDLHEVTINPNIVNNINKLIYHLDEPQADIAPLNIMLLCEKAKERGIKVLLSGAGGDDIFSGYRRHAALAMEKYWSWMPRILRQSIQNGADSLATGNQWSRKLRKLFENAGLNENERLMSYFFWSKNNATMSMLNENLRQSLTGYNGFAPLNRHLNSLEQDCEPLNKMLYLECKTFLPDHNLNYTDKTGMASGIEIRVPLLDRDLVETASRVPVHLKQKGLTGKYIFKKAMEPYLPRDIIYRPKSALPCPLRAWLLGDLKNMVHDVLSEEKIKRRGWFDSETVQKLINDNESRRIDASYPMWAMVSMELWAQIFLDQT
ncbi:MAG: asparagine synthase (glutamine-hydrolyzing) [Parcubacteria group bacterium]